MNSTGQPSSGVQPPADPFRLQIYTNSTPTGWTQSNALKTKCIVANRSKAFSIDGDVEFIIMWYVDLNLRAHQ
jgi:hypothetical protein